MVGEVHGAVNKIIKFCDDNLICLCEPVKGTSLLSGLSAHAYKSAYAAGLAPLIELSLFSFKPGCRALLGLHLSKHCTCLYSALVHANNLINTKGH